ncbi:unnamed protein product [Pedinophyceae sp. YPF-701]|nr:unnamed protein product [Pedinophyceae sp. YPF-701]
MLDQPIDALKSLGDGEATYMNFRARFIERSVWSDGSGVGRGSGASQLRASLGRLDIGAAASREELPLNEIQARRQKFALFQGKCSEVSQGLYVAGEPVARNRDLLRESGITHVVNTVAFNSRDGVQNFFEDELKYMTLRILDSTAEDLLGVLYDVLSFVDDAIASGGRVLLHCSQGVSRSAALAIAYIMWKTGRPYDEVYGRVKAARGIVNPNIGFICQLLQWHRRRNLPLVPVGSPCLGRPTSASSECSNPHARVFRLAPYSEHDPHNVVPKSAQPTLTTLDPRGAFVVHTATRMYVWVGERAPKAFVAAADRAVAHLQRFEGAPRAVTHVKQGSEPPELLAALGATGEMAWEPREIDAFTNEYELFHRPPPTGRPGGPAALPCGRGGASEHPERSACELTSPPQQQPRAGGPPGFAQMSSPGGPLPGVAATRSARRLQSEKRPHDATSPMDGDRSLEQSRGASPLSGTRGAGGSSVLRRVASDNSKQGTPRDRCGSLKDDMSPVE